MVVICWRLQEIVSALKFRKERALFMYYTSIENFDILPNFLRFGVHFTENLS